MSFVLDNSVAMNWLLADGKPADNAYAKKALEAIRADYALVPSVWALEAANVIAKAESKGLLTEAHARAFIAILEALNIKEDQSTAAKALGSTLEIARRYKLSAYDAAYLELALRTGLPLATLDSDLAKAAKKAGVQAFESA